jgi:hypothetical protein
VITARGVSPELQPEEAEIMTDSRVLGRIIGWLRAGYPEGGPDVDYLPLFALLGSQLTDDEVTAIADELAAGGPARTRAMARLSCLPHWL